MMASPLSTILNSINTKNELLDQEYIEEHYVPFVVNRAMSNVADSSFYAYEVAKFPDMPVYDQYLFYYYSLSNKRRFGTWHKPEKDKYLSIVMEAYGYSEPKARAALAILSGAQCEELARCIDKGGKR